MGSFAGISQVLGLQVNQLQHGFGAFLHAAAAEFGRQIPEPAESWCPGVRDLPDIRTGSMRKVANALFDAAEHAGGAGEGAAVALTACAGTSGGGDGLR